MKPKLSILFIITISILVPSILFTFFLYQTRSIPEVKLNFTVPYSKGKIQISEESIRILKNLKELPNEERLLTIYEREREHYILLVSIMAVILTIISVYFIFTRFVEKEEYQELRKSFDLLEKNFGDSLAKVEFNILIQDINSKSESYSKYLTLVDGDSKEAIKNKKDFDKYVGDEYAQTMQRMRNYISQTHFSKIYPYIFSFVVNICRYAEKKSFAGTENNDVQTNPYFEIQLSYLKQILGNSEYSKLTLEWKKVFPNLSL